MAETMAETTRARVRTEVLVWCLVSEDERLLTEEARGRGSQESVACVTFSPRAMAAVVGSTTTLKSETFRVCV